MMRSYLEKNLQYLFHLDRGLAERVKRIPLSDAVRVQPSRLGPPTLIAQASDNTYIQVHSLYDPLTEAKRFVEGKRLGQTDSLVICGFGLGYHVIEMYMRLKKGRWFVIIEGRQDIFRAALEYVDLSALLSGQKVRIFVGQDWSKFLEWFKDFLNESEVDDITVFTYPPSARLLPEFYKNLPQEMASAVNRRKVELATLFQSAEIFETNAIRNLPYVISSCGVKAFENRFAGIPAIVIAAGPSLNSNLELLAQLQNKALMICVGKTLKLLLKKNISPNFVANLDMTKPSKESFDGLSDLKGVNLVYDPDSYYEIISGYPGDRITFETIVPFNRWIRRFIGEKGFLEKGLSVAHTAFFFARYAGADPIILVGVDLAFPTDRTHADDVTMTWGGRVQERDPERVMVPCVKGGMVRSMRGFLSFINAFEIEIAKTPAKVINTTEEGALIRGAIHMPLREAIAQYCTDKYPIGEMVQRCLSEPRPFDKEAFARESKKVLSSADYIVNISEDALRYVKRLSRLDKTNKYDQPEYNKLVTKINEIRLQILQQEEILPLLQRVMSPRAAYIKDISRRLEGLDPHDAKQAVRLEMERFSEFFKAYREAARFFKRELEPVRQRLID
jgi:hypothetical protein